MRNEQSTRDRLAAIEQRAALQAQRIAMLERAVYGVAGAVLLAVVGALMSLVFRNT